MEQFETLAMRYGPSRVAWRYDPIVVGSRHDEAFHEQNFAALARRIAPMVHHCIVSFVDLYPSARRAFASMDALGIEQFDDPGREERRRIVSRLVAIGRGCGMPVYACCEADLVGVADAARCIDPEWIAGFASVNPTQVRSAPTRKGCGCAFARDIGAYQTCGHGCVYCYANESPDSGLRNVGMVDDDAEHLGSGQLVPSGPVLRKAGRDGQLELCPAPTSSRLSEDR